jgi:thymidylate kinase
LRRSAYYRSVALVGFDGSGKTTQAKLLRLLLEAGPRKARVFAVHPFGRKLLRMGVSPPLSPAAEGTSKKRPGPLRRLVAVADVLDKAAYLWLVRASSTLAALFGGREVWVVGDRSIEDVLIKHHRRGTLSGWQAALIRKLVPKFRLTILLEVAPEVAMARDGDFALLYYEELYDAYLAAAERLGWRVVREAGRGPEGVYGSVVEELARAGIDPGVGEPLRMVP